MSLYVLSPESKADLREIRDRIAKDNPVRAISFLEELTVHFIRLAKMPLIGRSRDDVRAGLRSFIHGNYVILYRPAAHGVDIVRVIHTRRDLFRLFEKASDADGG